MSAQSPVGTITCWDNHLLGRSSISDFEQLPAAGDSFELVLAAVAKLETRARDEIR
jgi:hypothetical protein